MRFPALVLLLAAGAGCGGSSGSTGAVGSSGPSGATGATGPSGPPGSSTAPSSGTVAIAVSEGNGMGGIAGPLAGVLVTAETVSGQPIAVSSDGGSALVVSAITDANGSAMLLLPLGVSELVFTKAGFTSPVPVQVGAIALQAVAVSVTMNESASAMPSLTVVAAGMEIGYGSSVALTAAATSPLGNALTYSWSNATAFGLGTVTGAGTAGMLTTPTLAQANQPQGSIATGSWVSGYAIPDTFGVLPVIGDTNGSTTATVTVSDGLGQSTSASVTVIAAPIQNGSSAIVVGARIYLNSGLGAGQDAGSSLGPGQAWSLALPAGSGSLAALDNAAAQFPSFVPDQGGVYTATLTSALADGGSSASHLTLYAGGWLGSISTASGEGFPSTIPTSVNGLVPFGVSASCAVCHLTGVALDEFTPWAGTKHAVKLTYSLDDHPGYAGTSGQECISCHTVGYDLANTNPIAGGFSQVAAQVGWTYPAVSAPGTWAAMPPPLQRLSNIQCENCHGPQSTAGHTLTNVDGMAGMGVNGVTEPFQSPRISYASENCGGCHAEGGYYHEYSEWAQLDSTHPSANGVSGEGHANLAIAQSEALTLVPDGGPAFANAAVYSLNTSCGRCHAAQGFTEYVDNINAGNVGALSPVQSAVGQISPNNVQPQTCQSCHDPHADSLDPVTGEDEFQLRVWNNTPLLPSGFAGVGLGAGAVCETCHNSRNGAYNTSLTTNATATAYLHEDSDWIGSNPGASNTALVAAAAVPGANYAGLGTKLTALGGPHEANQGDVFEGRNAYFLGNSTPVISPHAAVKDTCVGCHMTNNPGTFTSTTRGPGTTATHLFAITDAQVPTLCAKCHSAGTTNVDGASLQASVAAGLNTIVANMSLAVLNRVNDTAGAYTAPVSGAVQGYGVWSDTGTITIAAKGLTDTTPGCIASATSTCGSTNAGVITIVAGASGSNPALSALVIPEGRSGINVVLTFTSPVPITFSNGVVNNTLTSFTVNLTALKDANANVLFAPNGNMFKANWNWSLITQDESFGVHNPPFVSAVLSATADPFGNPNATPAQPGGLWY